MVREITYEKFSKAIKDSQFKKLKLPRPYVIRYDENLPNSFNKAIITFILMLEYLVKTKQNKPTEKLKTNLINVDTKILNKLLGNQD